MQKKKIKNDIFIYIFVIIILFTIFYKININYQNKIKTQETQHKEEIKKLRDQINDYQQQIEKKKNIIKEKNEDIGGKNKKIKNLIYAIENKNNIINYKKLINKLPVFKITAYDLSVKSCGKNKTSRGYGITRNGSNLKNKDLRTASTVACDPNVIPLGSMVYIMFLNQKYKRYNGIYICNDTGGKVKGNHLDLFMGDFHSTKESNIVNKFGVKKARVIILG